MKKISFFRWGMLCSLLFLCQITFSQIIPDFGSMQITYPINNSVFQQNSAGNANITFAGQILKGSYYTQSQLSQLALKVETFDYNTNSWSGNTYVKNISVNTCSGCSNDPAIDPQIFYINSNIAPNTLNAGWYRVAIGYTSAWNYLCYSGTQFFPLTKWTTFGIGYVFVVAGQSNASGFTRLYDNSLLPFETNAANISITDRNLLPNPHSELEDANIKEGSIIYRVRKRRDIEDNKTVIKGLPIYKEQLYPTNEGLQKFNSSKTGDFNDMSPAPNGFDSWSWCRFSNELVNAKKYPILTFNAALPNTQIERWLYGNWNGPYGDPSSSYSYTPNSSIAKNMLIPTLQMYGGAFGVKAVLWQQGEAETNQMTGTQVGTFPSKYNASTYPSANYSANLSQIINNSRTEFGNSSFKTLNWVISKTSYIKLPNDPLHPLLYATTTINGEKGISSNLSNANSTVNQQMSLISSSNRVFEGPNADAYDSYYRSPSGGLHFDGFQSNSSDGKSGLRHLAEEWKAKVSLLDNSNNITAQQPNKILLLKESGQYKLRVTNPDGSTLSGGTFYWRKNFDGITDANQGSSDTYPIPSSVSTSYYIICYYQANANSPLIPSQPYYVPATCSNCRVGSISSLVTRSFTPSASGGNSSSLIDNIKDGAWPKPKNCLPWTTLTYNASSNSFDVNVTPNNTGSLRIGSITIMDEVTGNDLQTLNITQAASSGCSQTNLSSLTPTNPSGEWSGWGNMHPNQSVEGNSLRVSGYTTGNGIGTHAGSRMVYNLGGQFNTFAGAVGRDDEADGCACGDMTIQFIIKADGVTLFTSSLLGTTSNKQPFSVDVSGKNTLELIVNDGGDNYYGDHADWLDVILYCGGGGTCTTPSAPTGVSSSPSTISSGSYSDLSANCTSGTPTWNTGPTGNTLRVYPTTTTTYSVTCVDGSCQSSSVSIGVTVSSGSCSAVTDNLIMGYWNGTPLVARFFHGQFWLTQRNGTNPENFVVRGSGMLQRGDVSLTNSSYASMVSCFAWTYSDYGSLQGPTSSTFPTPTGYTLYYSGDGTPYYLQNTGTPPSCSNTDLSNNWSYASADYNAPPKINAKSDGTTPIQINNVSYTKGIGTHAFSEIIYNLGSHNFSNFKASVGRDQASYGCNCGGQTISFKVVDNSNGTVLGGPYIKGIWENASDISVPISGVTSLKLVVEDGGDNVWGDWADWANARLECPSASQIKPSVIEEEWFWVSPNPNNGKLSARVQLNDAQPIQMFITDAQGRIIKEFTFEGAEGSNTFDISFPYAKLGIYHVKCDRGKVSSTKRVIIEE